MWHFSVGCIACHSLQTHRVKMYRITQETRQQKPYFMGNTLAKPQNCCSNNSALSRSFFALLLCLGVRQQTHTQKNEATLMK